MDEVNGDVTHWFALSENEAHYFPVCSRPLLRKGTGSYRNGLLLAATAARAGQCVQPAGKKEEGFGGGRDNGWVLLQSNANEAPRPLSNFSSNQETSESTENAVFKH